MAGGRTLAVLGSLAVALVAAGLWFALSEGDPDGDAHDAADDPSAAAAEKGAATAGGVDKTPRRRSKSAGDAALSGFVKRRDGKKPVAGQKVELLREGHDPWTADTDAAGAFRLDALPDGGPFELRVESKGFATVRLPGIGLGRGEQRDVGTLWLDQAVRLPVSVRDFQDRPVAGADVRAYVAPEYGDDFDWSKAWAQMAVEPVAVATAKSDAQGAAVFPELASGSWTIVATAPGRARGADRHVELRGGEEPRPVILRLALGHDLGGRVLDADKKPVVGATVLSGMPNDAWDLAAAATRGRAVSDEQGRWKIDGVAGGKVALWVGRAGTVPTLRATVLVPSVREYDLVLRATGSIAGTVTAKESGKPVEGAVVRASQWGWSPQTAEATTDAEGRYRIESFPTGDVHELKAEKEGWVFISEGAGWYGNQDRKVYAGDELKQDLKLQLGATVRGRVTCGGAPVESAKVVVRVGSPTKGIEWSRSATTAADGTWTIEHAPPGKAFGQVSKEGHWQRDFPDQWWTLVQSDTSGEQFRVTIPESGEAELNLVLERGTSLRGRVDGPEGPVAGAKVAGGGASATTAADGTFALEGIEPGPAVLVHASKRGLASKSETTAVPEEGAAPELVLKLEKPPVVRGRVTSGDAQPLRDARVRIVTKGQTQAVYGPWAQDDDAVGSAAGPVLPDGSFEIELPMTAGTFAVRASDPERGSVESAVLRIEPGRADYQADLSFGATATIRGRVLSGGRGIAGAEVALERPQTAGAGMVYYGGMGGAAVVYAVADADGRFEVRPVVAGTWNVIASASGYVKGRRDAVVVPTGEEIVIDLSAALALAGKVTYQDGSPVAGVQVQAQPGGGANVYQGPMGGDDEEGARQATTGRDGGFRLTGLAPGSWRLRVEPAWSSSVNVRATTSEPFAAGTEDARVVVQPGGTIAGKVVDATGKGLSGAWINANSQSEDGNGEWRAAMSKDDGTFVLTGLSDRPCTLNVQMQGGGYQQQVVKAVAVGTKDLRVELSQGLAIEGVLVGADGKPVAGVYLQASRVRSEDDEDADGMIFGGDVQPTDSAGKFRVGGLAAGRYSLRSAGWGSVKRWRLQGADDVAAGTKGLRIVATEGARLAGIVVDDAGAAVPGATVQASSPDGDWVQPVQTDGEGRFTITGFAEGAKLHVSVTAAGRASKSMSDVAAGAADLRIVLEKGVRSAGRLVDAAGKPLAQAHVVFALESAEHQGHAQAQTDDQGRFTVDGLREGTWKASVWRQGETPQSPWTSEPVGTFAAGATDVELRLTK